MAEGQEWIIAVDDDAGLLDSFKRILTRKYRVSLFSTPAEALEAIRTEGCPDLVISGKEIAVFEGDRIALLRDEFDSEAEAAMGKWMAEHGAKLQG